MVAAPIVWVIIMNFSKFLNVAHCVSQEFHCGSLTSLIGQSLAHNEFNQFVRWAVNHDSVFELNSIMLIVYLFYLEIGG